MRRLGPSKSVQDPIVTNTAATPSHISKFQQLLRDLFQFDCADLDFSIYRIMNFKRDAIERFITEDLAQIVSDELDSGPLVQQVRAVQELEELAQEVRETLGEYIDAQGNLDENYHGTTVGRKYLNAKEKVVSGARKSRESAEIDIFNHLYTFFSRYYQDGDFISKRRYSKRHRYAIPYNGEEVYLHWANSDQYYIKTAEHFHDYTWKAPNDVAVHFKLLAVNVEQNNVKGDKRFFLPRTADTKWDPDTTEIIIPFEYRPLTQQEKRDYGNQRQQDKIIAEAAAAIPRRLDKVTQAQAALTRERNSNDKGETITYLEYHLRQYTRRNTSDFFIHKDLKGFLARELDFYLKNEVLNLDEMENAGQDMADGWFQTLRLIKSVGNRIIDFLDQIENFQKMLWEKRKFITETQYCITLGSIDTVFYPDIVTNQAQWDEWREMLGVDKNDRGETFLQANPTLVLDTKHFPQKFVDRLVASFPDLNGTTDGLLMQGDNWQALSLLREQYSRQIACVHIDPPYNTQTSGFLYKNDYQHSSWLAMMQNRILAAVPMLHENGAFLSHIDENEYEVLYLLFSKIGIPDGGTVVWDKKNPMLGRQGIATQHEYVLWRTWSGSSVHMRPKKIRMILNEAESIVRKHGEVNEQAKKEFQTWISEKEGLTGGERAYNNIDNNGRVFQSVAMGAPEPRSDPKFHVPLIHPITMKECPVPTNGWSRTPKTLQELKAKDEILFGKDETVQPRKKVLLTAETGRQLSSIIRNSSRGKNDVDKIGLQFPYCHPVSLYEELFGAAASKSKDVVLDHFAVSGTTGHAVINLNREDGRQRKFILVEMGGHFDTVLLPRIKKVVFAPEWKDGKPKRTATSEEAERSPRIVKYIRLESYEDALNNIEIDDRAGQAAMRFGFDDYLLKYMLNWETKSSETLLNVEKLVSPFSYQLNTHIDGQTRTRTADVPETFNYLLGLIVRTRRVYDDSGRRYLVYQGETRANPGQVVAVIWRDTTDWNKADFERDKHFVEENRLVEGVDALYVNGDSFIPNAKALEPLFKSRMFAGAQS